MDARLISYLYCFNVERDYFECHEYGESLWLDTGRPPVLKGLIQAAVCLYHLDSGNVRGGWRMWQRARRYLLNYVGEAAENQSLDYAGIHFAKFVQDIDRLWLCVPTQWHTETVSRDEISHLQLPTVVLQLTDPNLAEKVVNWQLPNI